MELIDDISRLLGDDLKQVIRPGVRLQIGALCLVVRFGSSHTYSFKLPA